MSMKFEKIEEREPEHAELSAKGTGVGAMLSMQTAFDLSEADGGTAMKWQADVSIAGPVGAMGQRVLQPIVNQQVGQVLNALDRQVTAAAAGSGDVAPADADDVEAGPPVPAEATSDAEPAEGASGADEGISPLSPETYSEDPQGPTTSTEDTR
jgi:hypothetical protein